MSSLETGIKDALDIILGMSKVFYYLNSTNERQAPPLPHIQYLFHGFQNRIKIDFLSPYIIIITMRTKNFNRSFKFMRKPLIL